MDDGRSDLSVLPHAVTPARTAGRGPRLAVRAFRRAVGHLAILPGLLPARRQATRHRIESACRSGTCGPPPGNVPAGPRHRGHLPAPQAKLRTARQPGAPRALAPVPPLGAGPGTAPARLVRPGPGGTRCGRKPTASGRGAQPGGDNGGPSAHLARPAHRLLMTPRLRLGTRGSPLALWQANYVADRIRAAAPDRAIQLVEI